jgi:hypothetical protein
LGLNVHLDALEAHYWMIIKGGYGWLVWLRDIQNSRDLRNDLKNRKIPNNNYLKTKYSTTITT